MPALSIRAILLLTLATLTAMVTLLAANEMYDGLTRLNNLHSLKGAVELSDRLFSATEQLSVERDVALSMLEGTPDEQKPLEDRLKETRAGVDEEIRTNLATLSSYSFGELVTLQANTLKRFAVIKQMRSEIDRDLRLPKESRDPALPAKWMKEISALLDETQGLWTQFVKHFLDIDPVVTQRLRYKHLMRSIIDYNGVQRSLVGQLLAENVAPTPEQYSELVRGQGAMELGWKMTRVIADQSRLYPDIAAAYTDARSHYDTLYEMFRDVFYVLPQPNQKVSYPITSDLWFELSTQAADSLVTLRDESTLATRRYVDALIATAENNILIQAAVFLLALLVSAYGFWVIIRRVIRPVNTMIDALMRTTRGEVVAFSPAVEATDEIGKLGQVLRVFQINAEQIRRAAVELDRSQSHLRAVVDHAVDGLITSDITGRISAFNPACERLFGYSAEAMIGENVAKLLPSSDGEENAAARALAFMSAATSESETREFVARRKDGTLFSVELSISAFPLDGVQHFSAIIRDITKRKEAEEALRTHTQALERSNKELDDFAYIASHDLKEPLRGIHNHSRFLLEDNAEKLDQDSAGRLNRLVYLSQRMERLVNDLLYFSRLGRQELAIQQTDLGAVITDIESTLDVFLAERGAKIVMPAKLPTIVCDKPRVTELFRNLITNAIKYNDKAEKIVEIGWLPIYRNAEGKITRNVAFVRDNGRGIDREFHTEIFRIFKRLQGGKEAEEGTGVGLTFVKKIVERHGGHIWLESEKGSGTTFYFTLEASQDGHEHGSQVAA